MDDRGDRRGHRCRSLCLARVRRPRLRRAHQSLRDWPGGKEPAAAICRLEPDGTLAVITGVVDMSGAVSGFGVIAAEAFGVAPDQVKVVSLDTDGAPQSPLSGGSVVTYSSGRAIQAA